MAETYDPRKGLTWEVHRTEDGEWGLYVGGSQESLAEFESEDVAHFVCAACNVFRENVELLVEGGLLVNELLSKAALAPDEAAISDKAEDFLESLQASISKMEELW